MSAVTIRQMAGRVEELLTERVGARGRDFDQKLRHVGRRLPRRVRKSATALSQAATMTQNPRLHARLDEGAIAQDYDICMRYLGPLGRAGRGSVATALVAKIAFPVLLTGGAFIGFLAWRGLI